MRLNTLPSEVLLVLLMAAPVPAAPPKTVAKTTTKRAVVPALVGTWKGAAPEQGGQLTVTLRTDGRYSLVTRAERGTSTEKGTWWGDGKKLFRQTPGVGDGKPIPYAYEVQGGKTLLLTAPDGSRLRFNRAAK